jgi:ABC-2 type transport system ATP-binding protein
MFAIEIKDIRKKYRDADTPALDGFSFCVKQTQIAGLLGPNGAGKTTCINILCGVVKPDSGTALINGKDCTKETTAIRYMTGLTPQQIALFGELTAQQNFMYIGRLYGIDDHTTRNRMKTLTERLGLDQHINKRINEFSGGTKRRANIIASLLHEPELLILDEPTAGVDVQSRAMIIDFLKEYRALGKTILYTSHLLDEAEQICDTVVIIDEGRHITGGTPQELIANTAGCSRLEDVFIRYTGRKVRD